MQQLDIKKTIKLLEKNRFPFPESKIVNTLEQTKKAAEEIKYPIALKIVAPELIHKSDIKGVKTNLENQEQLEKAFNDLQNIIKKKKIKKAEILVQKMESGTEVIIGLKRDPQFGPVILFGLGGIFTEILKDTSLRITPIEKSQALEMIKEIKSFPILEGVRGGKPVNLNALIDIIVKTSNLVEKDKNIQELDFNPIILNEKSAVIVDARIMVD